MSKEDVDKIIEDALGVIDDTPKETQELVVKKETPIVPIPTEEALLLRSTIFKIGVTTAPIPSPFTCKLGGEL